ncbi:Iron-sulfur assembly protein 1 [Sporothrix epigloea]|uniref:Iron-sulfur assembly protein 1 n=1 Tax=Sporothrix epigloea TaxID=1892477 RepID=A0ABP0D2X1_9PEZI
MNSHIPRRSAESACLFCRQSLVRQWRQQRQHSLFSQSNAFASFLPVIQPISPPSQQRRRYLSGTAAVRQPSPFAQPIDTLSSSSPTAAAATPRSTKASKSNTPYTRYSLYTEPASPMTMQPPPPPTPVVDIDTPEEDVPKAVPKSTATATAAPTPASTPTPTPAATATPAQKAAAVETTPTQPEPSSTASAASVTAAADPTPAAPKKRSKLRAPRKAAMRLTPAAVEQVRELLEGPEPKLIKVGVRNRGCSGLAYDLQYVDKPGAFDELVEQDGVRVLVDSKALFSIIGSEMDWVEDKLNQRFVFRNPNIKEQCGCGESFMV